MSQKTDLAGSLSNIGCVRTHNEDSVIVQPPLYAVADGMGGHAAGEVASELAVDILAENALSINDAASLISTVRVINRSIIEAAENGTGRPGMGTTLTAALIDGRRLLLAQVGDSRAYLLHNGALQQLTRDHSYVGELLAGGHISASEAASHPKRSVITRALGSDPKTEADIYELEASPGDTLLLCSDGLYGMVPNEEIASLLSAEPDPQAACEALIAAARDSGGLDNISAIVVKLNTEESGFLLFDEDEVEGRAGRSTSSYRARHGRDGGKRRLQRFHVGILAFVVLLVLLVGCAVGGVYWYASNSAFVRSEEGRVVVYRGLPGEVLPGLSLQWYEYSSDVLSSDLLASTAERLEEGIRVDNLNDAATLIASYEEQAARQQARQGGGTP
ncbi:MAG: Stp1/IreP family PP2C-type Ser/Thr phosphatase [Coriobacteriales bacterium]|jgi:protein phosphatase|nr:Stp1/IreP family PP2C-type Ser/Thr phosphatase [Coriobacteriales bacterium]